jgi:hypothetical protein
VTRWRPIGQGGDHDRGRERSGSGAWAQGPRLTLSLPAVRAPARRAPSTRRAAARTRRPGLEPAPHGVEQRVPRAPPPALPNQGTRAATAAATASTPSCVVTVSRYPRQAAKPVTIPWSFPGPRGRRGGERLRNGCGGDQEPVCAVRPESPRPFCPDPMVPMPVRVDALPGRRPHPDRIWTTAERAEGLLAPDDGDGAVGPVQQCLAHRAEDHSAEAAAAVAADSEEVGSG